MQSGVVPERLLPERDVHAGALRSGLREGRGLVQELLGADAGLPQRLLHQQLIDDLAGRA
jgi:hypothetical protein